MTVRMSLVDSARPFLAYLEEWYAALEDLPMRDVVADEPERVAIISIDVINGFLRSGALASERIERIAQPVAAVFEAAYAQGVRALAATQDTHDANALEFQVYPPHSIKGTEESEAVDELKRLSFFNEIAIFPKNSINSHIGTGLGDWLSERPQLDRFIVIGDCTDLCAYQAAMQLRLEANALNLPRRVIVPAHAVETFDTPVSTARELGIYAHDGELHHLLFLYHMAMNGVEVVRSLI